VTEHFANHYITTLTAKIVEADTSVVVKSVTGIPAVPFRAVIGRKGAYPEEIVIVTLVVGTTLTITRAAEATAGVQTAWKHPVGATLTASITAESMAATASSVALYDTYTTKADGIPSVADSGHAWFQYPASGTQAMRVVSGKLTNTAAAGAAAGYQQCDLGAPVTRIGCDFVLGAYTTNNGSFALVTWKTLHDAAPIPDSNFHLTVNATGWQVMKWVSGTPTTLKSGVFVTPLTADGATIYRIDAVLAGNTASIFLPDNTVGTVTDAAIGDTPGHIACFETYQADAATDTKSAAVAVWADASSLVRSVIRPMFGAEQVIPAIAPLLPPGGFPRPVASLLNTDGNYTPTDAFAEIDTDLRVTFVAGPTGAALVDCDGYIQLGAALFAFLWKTYQVGGAAEATCWVMDSNGTQFPLGVLHHIHAHMIFGAGAFTPGFTYTLAWSHIATTANAGTYMKVGVALGIVASMTVTPL
jgi:hypothetical protein